MTEDQQLLESYSREGSESAFNELVARHINLVHSAAVRLMGGDTHLAQDAVQTVFTDLSRKAPSLTNCTSLAGWLYRHTFFVCSSAVRKEQRRRQREKEAASMNDVHSNTDPDWEKLGPILDRALAEMKGRDRDILVMRYFEGLDWKTVGVALGTSEDTAQKRASRALEKLRNSLAGSGATFTTSALGLAMAQNAMNAAPAHLAAQVSGSVLSGTGAGSGAAVGWLKAMAWLKAEAAIVGAGVAVATGLFCIHWITEDQQSASFQRIPTAGNVAQALPVQNSESSPTRIKTSDVPFSWRDVESPDYREYVARLRLIGCPEEVIRDLIIADLNQAYAPKMAAEWTPPQRPYWKKNRSADEPAPDQIDRLRVLNKEKSDILTYLLGTPVSVHEVQGIGMLSLREAEMALSFLAPDLLKASLQALDESGVETRLDRMRDANPGMDVEVPGYSARRKALEKVLSPEALAEYQVRYSPKANWLRHEVSFLNCTKDEFMSLLLLREDHLGESNERLTLDRLTAIADIRSVMGEAKAAEYVVVSDMGYTNARHAADRSGLDEQLADQAGRIVFDARSAAEKAAMNTSLSVEERLRQIESLELGAAARLNEVLGSSMNAAIRQALQFSMANTAQFVRR